MTEKRDGRMCWAFKMYLRDFNKPIRKKQLFKDLKKIKKRNLWNKIKANL